MVQSFENLRRPSARLNAAAVGRNHNDAPVAARKNRFHAPTRRTLLRGSRL